MALRPVVVVFEACDVVLAEVVAALNLYEDKCLFAGVRDAVRRADGDVHGLAGRERNVLPVERDARAPRDDHPVLRAPRVPLIAQALARQNIYALDLVPLALVEHRERPPRP